MKDGGTAKLEAVSYSNKNTLDTKQLQPEDAMRLNEKPNDGGPAFPRSAAFSPECGTLAGTDGMSLLDWFAGRTMGAIHSSGRRMADYNTDAGNAGVSAECLIAIDAYNQAQQMLHERERRMTR